MSFLSSARFRFIGAVSLALLAGCSDSTGSATPTSVAPGNTNTVAEGTAGTVLTTAPAFVVKDQDGNAMSGVGVTVAVTAGGGTLTDAPTVTRDGATPVGTWKLGNIAGINTITVTVSGLQPLVISVTGKAGPPASLTFTTGSNQSALAGTPVASAPVAKVADQFGNGVSGAPVTFLVTEGEGTLSSNAAVTTDINGNATSPQWTLGKSAVPQALRAATTGGINSSVFAFVSSDYTVDLRFFGPSMPSSTSGMFTAAAARIKGAVVGDMIDINVVQPVDLAAGCDVEGLPTAFAENVDDVIIYASVGPIDGAGSVLAFSFPCFVRAPFPARQTVIGIMKFDEADIDGMIARGNMTDVIQHEMLHVVGIGTLWSSFNFVQEAGTPQSRYTGPLGVQGCIALGGADVCPGSVPLETGGGAGTRDAHWSEAVFFNELMTGFVNTRQSVPTGILNPLSSMSISSLGDVGYTVNAKAADPYTIPGHSAASILAQLSVSEGQPAWEQVHEPKFTITHAGKISIAKKQ